MGATAALISLPWAGALPQDAARRPPAGRESWDMSWTAKLSGKRYRACVDCVDHENGVGVWRAGLWESQYESVLGAHRSDIVTVLVLRHVASLLALDQPFWNRYGIAAARNVKHPITGEVTTRNPALLTAADGITPPFGDFTLPRLIDSGTIVLACGVALRQWSAWIAREEKVSGDEAFEMTVRGMVPGVLVQPSGVFATAKAQHEGCVYVRGS